MIKQCKNGHLFDGDKFVDCPYCSSTKGTNDTDVFPGGISIPITGSIHITDPFSPIVKIKQCQSGHIYNAVQHSECPVCSGEIQDNDCYENEIIRKTDFFEKNAFDLHRVWRCQNGHLYDAARYCKCPTCYPPKEEAQNNKEDDGSGNKAVLSGEEFLRKTGFSADCSVEIKIFYETVFSSALLFADQVEKFLSILSSMQYRLIKRHKPTPLPQISFSPCSVLFEISNGYRFYISSTDELYAFDSENEVGENYECDVALILRFLESVICVSGAELLRMLGITQTSDFTEKTFFSFRKSELDHISPDQKIELLKIFENTKFYLEKNGYIVSKNETHIFVVGPYGHNISLKSGISIFITESGIRISNDRKEIIHYIGSVEKKLEKYVDKFF